MARVAYGVDFDGNEAVVVQAETTHRGVRCKHIAADDPTWRERSGGGPVSAAALTARESLVQWIEAPYPDRRKALKVLPTLLDIRLPFPLEGCVYEFLALGAAAGGKVEALAVAARRGEIESRLHTLAEAGFDPRILDHEGLALWTQSLRETPAAAGAGARAVVYLGASRTSLVVGHGSRFQSLHAIRHGDYAQIHRMLKSAVQEGEEWLVCLAGPLARDPEVVRAVEGALGAHRLAPTVIHDEPEAFLARALAVRALGRGALRCNLRGRALEHGADRDARAAGLRRAAVLALLGGLLAGTSGFVLRGGLVRQRDALRAEVQRRAEALAGYDLQGARGSDAVRIAERSVDDAVEALRPFQAGFAPSLTQRLAPIIQRGAESGLRYQVLDLSDKAVFIAGRAAEWGAPEALLADLRAFGYPVTLAREDADRNDLIPFKITSGGAQ